MKLTIYRAHCTGDAKNCLYPVRLEVNSETELAKAVAFDHVVAEYAGNYRNVGNFVLADTVVMDLDNDHSEAPTEWIDPEKLAALLPDVAFAWAPSRHNLLQKGDRSPRPRGHVYFPILPLSDVSLYTALKRAIHKALPFFDGNALDAARFIFGSETGEVFWHDSWATIDETVPFSSVAEKDVETTFITDNKETLHMPAGSVIPAGQRNNTLFRYALRVLIRFQDTPKAVSRFRAMVNRCDPPLTEEEIRSIWASANKYAKEMQSKPGYVPPEEYDNDFANLSLKPEDYSDMGEAKVLVKEFGSELLYTDATNFIRFDGICWRENGHAALGIVEELMDLQLQETSDEVEMYEDCLSKAGISKELIRAGGDNLQKAANANNALPAYIGLMDAQSYHKFVMRYRNFRNLANTLSTVRPMVAADVNDLDRDGFLLNTPNATWDLQTGQSRPHQSSDHITKVTACAPGNDGREIWEQALQTFFCGDSDLIDYVQQIVGLAAIGKVYMEALIIAYGSGRNGKSTFWNTISRVLGTYAGYMSADALTVGCRRNVKPEMAELKGKRLIIAAELEEGTRLSTSILKQLCSTDTIYAEKKYKAPFGFTPSHTVVLYTNHLPRVSAADDGTWRRLIVIPFNAVIEGNSDIKNYSEYLFENAGPAVLQWILEGAQKAIQRNYRIPLPPVVTRAVEAFRMNNDWLGHFLEECCETGEGLLQKSGELYTEYRAFCMRTGEYTRSTTDFYSALEQLGFARIKTRTGNLMRGLRLRSAEIWE